MEISLIFSILSGVFLFWGYFVYNKDIFRGLVKPSAVSWGIWTATTILNMVSYFMVTNDVIKISLPIVETFACFFTFIYALCKRNLSSITRTGKLTIFISTVAIIIWWLFRSAFFANMILQIAIIAGFVSTYQNVWINPTNEKAFPWIIFSFAYLFLFVTVILRFTGTVFELVSPTLGVILHSALVFLIVFKQKMSDNMLKS